MGFLGYNTTPFTAIFLILPFLSVQRAVKPHNTAANTNLHYSVQIALTVRLVKTT